MYQKEKKVKKGKEKEKKQTCKKTKNKQTNKKTEKKHILFVKYIWTEDPGSPFIIFQHRICRLIRKNNNYNT